MSIWKLLQYHKAKTSKQGETHFLPYRKFFIQNVAQQKHILPIQLRLRRGRKLVQSLFKLNSNLLNPRIWLKDLVYFWFFWKNFSTYCKLAVIIAEVVNCSKVKIIVINFYVRSSNPHAYHPVCMFCVSLYGTVQRFHDSKHVAAVATGRTTWLHLLQYKN